ncbi:NAD-binding protein [Streptacidiphilus fuscans]|uniref:NAD-binding protein n=1 Tax=Streptacidiphilus fuscans TaxID=2789292 RepID=A0A931FBF2_9ACTN|nr:NAD(P)-binding protein [Streptacidiphilus fuscans]MBF9067383.1 NAD-binding protein [Streptacidiphilus fuscans]
MVVVGNDALTHRLAADLAALYGERVVLIVPEPHQSHGQQLMALHDETGPITVLGGEQPDAATLRRADLGSADALALVLDDDQAVTQAALIARSINPTVRLALRVHSGALGQRLRALLDRDDAPTTVASASATAAPALVSAALPSHRQVIPINGGTCAVVTEVLPEDATGLPDGEGVPIAVLTEDSGTLLPGPDLVPSDAKTTVVRLRHLEDAPPPPRERAWDGRRLLAMVRGFFSRKLQVAAVALAVLVALLTVLTWQLTGTNLGLSLYLVLLDLSSAGNPAFGQPLARQVLQIITMFTGMLLLGLVAAVVLDSVGAVRPTSTVRRVRRTVSDHVLLIGLGNVGRAVASRLVDMRVPVVAVERNASVPGVAAMRALGVPVVVGDFTRESVFRAARGDRAAALTALTNNDSANLQAVLFAREQRPDLRVVLRLFDEAFARTVYDALRQAHPEARTRSRSVSYLAAPEFAAAMMGRQVLAAIPARRELLLLADVTVQDGGELAGRTVTQAFRPGAWRVVATPRKNGGAGLNWTPKDSRELRDGERVIVVATREGLGRLLRRDAGSGGVVVPAQTPPSA